VTSVIVIVVQFLALRDLICHFYNPAFTSYGAVFSNFFVVVRHFQVV